MCGIAGIVAPPSPQRRATLERMTAALSHRGPDGEGFWESDACALGHRRLSIIDLQNGEQPMPGADAMSAVTFNGEIYGFAELKGELKSYPFRTHCDTEVLLALYEQHGVAMPRHLPGMFAFALWDERAQHLLAARDRFGEKPFFYAWGNRGEFLFASEIKALIASQCFRPHLNRDALGHYLRHLYVHPTQTIYENVHVLPPAHSLVLKSGKMEIERYWQLPVTRSDIASPASLEETLEEFDRLFERAVQKQLVADVPVAAFLSGGLDSSSVVAAATRHHSQLVTLAFGFESSNSELPFARGMAQKLGTTHIELETPRTEIGELMCEMARVFDEPFADSSNIPTYLIAQAARRHAKVVLTGDGGDELLAGYDFWYRPLWHFQKLHGARAKLALVLHFASRALSRLGVHSLSANGQYMARAGRMRSRHTSLLEAHTVQNSFFTAEQLQVWGFCTSKPHTDLGQAPSHSVDDALRFDLGDYLPGDVLVKTDRAAMAHGLELRAPFLDVDFASFCIALALHFKMTAAEDKWILRQAFASRWTPAVRARGKQGFGAPVDVWLQRPDVVALSQRVLHDPKHALWTLLPFETSRFAVQQGGYQTWILLTLGLWLEAGGQNAL